MRYTHITGKYVGHISTGTRFRILDSMYDSFRGSYVIALDIKTVQGNEVLQVVDEGFIQQAIVLPPWASWEEDAKIQFYTGPTQKCENYMHFSKLFSTPTELAVWKGGCTSHSSSEAFLLSSEEAESAVLHGTAPF